MSSLNEYEKWLRKHESGFLRKLSEFGGYYKGRQILINGIVEPNFMGEYTGYGRCMIATAAIEEASRNEYGNLKIYTVDSNVKPRKRLYVNTTAHTVLRANGVEDGKLKAITVDATLRQYNFNARNKIYIFPTEKEKTIYRGNVVRARLPMELVRETRGHITRGFYEGVNICDYEDLVQTLLD